MTNPIREALKRAAKANETEDVMADKTELKPGDTVWLVKYALSNGPQECVVDGLSSAPGRIYVDGYCSGCQLGRDVFMTWGEAVMVMNAMRDKKIASLKKQIAKLEKMTW